MIPRYIFGFALLLLAGCATDEWNAGMGKPPAKAGRVQAAIYDSTPRQPTDKLDIYEKGQKADRPNKPIALLTCEGAVHEEAVMLTAIVWRARLLGAHGLEILEPDAPYGTGPSYPFGPPTDRRVFRARAIVYP
jgi:hypothetical protein